MFWQTSFLRLKKEACGYYLPSLNYSNIIVKINHEYKVFINSQNLIKINDAILWEWPQQESMGKIWRDIGFHGEFL